MTYRRKRTFGWTDFAALFAGLWVVAMSFFPGLIPLGLLDLAGGDKAGHFLC